MSSILNSSVLVLNKYNLPMSVITVKEAMGDLFSEKAEVVYVDDGSYENYDIYSWIELSQLKQMFKEENIGNEEWLNSPSIKVQVPRIIRSKTFGSAKRKKKIRFSRRNVCIRDNYTCQYCGKKLNSKDIQLEHVYPQSRGGKSIWENIVVSCHHCNTKKKNRTPEEAGMKLIRNPFEPKYSFAVRNVNDKRYESWKTFISNVYWNVELKE